MSELKIDNPAQRLLDILESGKTHPARLKCRDVWKKILDVNQDNEHLLLSRLAKVLELSDRIIQVRENNFSSLRGNSSHWKTRVERAFMAQSLNNDWESFIQHIDTHTISELAMLSDLFESRGAHATMKDDEIETLIERVAELRAEIRTSDLSTEMKSLLLRQLSQIQDALESYDISGIEPVLDAVQSTIGLTALHQGYRTELKDGQFSTKISQLLNDASNAVTAAGALPALAAAASSVITYLSS